LPGRESSTVPGAGLIAISQALVDESVTIVVLPITDFVCFGADLDHSIVAVSVAGSEAVAVLIFVFVTEDAIAVVVEVIAEFGGIGEDIGILVVAVAQTGRLPVPIPIFFYGVEVVVAVRVQTVADLRRTREDVRVERCAVVVVGHSITIAVFPSGRDLVVGVVVGVIPRRRVFGVIGAIRTRVR